MQLSTAGEGTGIKLSMLLMRHEDSAMATRKKNNPGKGDRNANAAGPDRYEASHAEFTRAGGGHSSSTCRVRHWLTSTLHRHSFASHRWARPETSRRFAHD